MRRGEEKGYWSTTILFCSTLLYVSTQTDLYEMLLVVRDDGLPIMKIEGKIDFLHRPMNEQEEHYQVCVRGCVY